MASDATARSYSAPWRRFTAYCAARGHDALTCAEQLAADYLSQLYSPGDAQTGTILRHRAAIVRMRTMLAQPWPGRLIATTINMIKRLRPVRARYNDFYDPRRLGALYTATDNDTMALAALQRKTVVLLAVAKLLRVSDIVRIAPSTIEHSGEQTTRFTVLTPKQSRGAYDERYTLTALPEHDAAVCPLRALRAWLRRRSEWRAPPPPDKLWLSEQRHHDAITSEDTIARWIKRALAAAGIDTRVYKAHSVRGAVATCAIDHGMAPDDVRRTGRWRGMQTLTRFYDRSRRDAPVDRLVLATTPPAPPAAAAPARAGPS